MHTYTGTWSGGLGWIKGRGEAAYVCSAAWAKPLVMYNKELQHWLLDQITHVIKYRSTDYLKLQSVLKMTFVCDVVRLGRHIKPCGLACHRGLSWVPYCSSYTLAGLIDLIEEYGLKPHLYADDTQIQGSCRFGSANQLQSTLSACLDKVYDWMLSNRLQLNTA